MFSTSGFSSHLQPLWKEENKINIVHFTARHFELIKEEDCAKTEHPTSFVLDPKIHLFCHAIF